MHSQALNKGMDLLHASPGGGNTRNVQVWMFKVQRVRCLKQLLGPWRMARLNWMGDLVWGQGRCSSCMFAKVKFSFCVVCDRHQAHNGPNCSLRAGKNPRAVAAICGYLHKNAIATHLGAATGLKSACE